MGARARCRWGGHDGEGAAAGLVGIGIRIGIARGVVPGYGAPGLGLADCSCLDDEAKAKAKAKAQGPGL